MYLKPNCEDNFDFEQSCKNDSHLNENRKTDWGRYEEDECRNGDVSNFDCFLNWVERETHEKFKGKG